MAEVTILGGGVIGLSIAEELSRDGARVRVLERAAFGAEASWAGAGMLPPGRLDAAVTPEARLRSLSHTLWPELTQRLAAETGIDNGFRLCGALRLFETATERDAEAEVWRAEGVRAESLTATEARRLEPALGPGPSAAIHLPDQGQVRNPRHVRALAAACAARGVELVAGIGAAEWEITRGQVTGVQTGRGVFRSDRYCVAAGAWSAGLVSPLGIALPVRPVRGQIVLLDALPTPPRRIIELGRRYLVPRPDGLVLVGATEEDAGFEKRNTTAAVTGLLDLAARLCPSLADASVIRFWAGLRPGSADGLPHLGRVPGYNNVFVAAGHFRSGLQMSPGTARVMRQTMLDQPTDIPLDGFEVGRGSPTSDVT